jgi:TRAP-type C4-dicarboxylate transport system permease small subunit
MFKKYRDVLLCLILVIATLAVYWQVRCRSGSKLDF